MIGAAHEEERRPIYVTPSKNLTYMQRQLLPCR